MKLVILTLLALFCALGFSARYTIASFEGPPFSVKPPSGMHELGGLGLEALTNGANIVAYGDFNNDKYTDIVTLADDKRTLTILLYSHDNFKFSTLTSFSVGTEETAAVITGDFNYDGRLDLLAVTLDPSGAKSYLNYFFRQDGVPYFGETKGVANLRHELNGKTQPFVFDANGDRNLDVMYVEDNVRKIQYVSAGQLSTTDFSEFVSTGTGCKDYSLVSGNSFATPHSNAFIDFNGDCAADLFITSVDSNNNRYFEIWLRNPADQKFCLVDATKINQPISLVSFGDIRNSGRLDLIFATQPASLTEPMKVNIIYNGFRADPSSPCRLQDSSMTSPYKSTAYNSQSSTADSQVVQLPARFSAGTRLYSADADNRPSKIRVADINIDGYSDLLFVVNDPTTSDRSYGSIILAVNQKGTVTLDSTTVSDDDKPFYIFGSGSSNVDLSAVHAQSASFFDFDELGRLGIWVVVNDNIAASSKLMGVFNFVNSENFILKTLGLNGYRVSEHSEDIRGSLGGVYYGASVECKVTDIDGDGRLSKGAQMPQSAYTPLDLPYVFIGLGRTNNYVENFAMGISRNKGSSDQQQQTWTPIIPNSQLIVNTLINREWTLDVYVNPTSETILIVLTTLVILIILGAFIIYLQAKEKEEDKIKAERYLI